MPVIVEYNLPLKFITHNRLFLEPVCIYLFTSVYKIFQKYLIAQAEKFLICIQQLHVPYFRLIKDNSERSFHELSQLLKANSRKIN
jgi:hypothetical protein